MPKSECVTQVWTLDTIEPGVLVDVVDILTGDPEVLLVHGIRPGARLGIDGYAPFGGPRIVTIGGCRVAIDRQLARSIQVARVDDDTATAESGA
jgi:Fe2+ transport system protein FeoA